MQRKALFVGINDYEGGLTPLSCACNDANDLCDYFRDQLGYETYVLRNADILKIRKKIAEVTAELQKGDVFLFFFAGHGFTVDKGENNDRRLATARDLKDHLEEGEGGISLRRLKKLTKGGYSRVFILDACQTKIDTTNITRSVGNLEQEKFRTRDLSIISSIVGAKNDLEDVAPLLVINSCNVGDVAYELERNGLFTWAFLKMLSKMKDNGEAPVFNAKLVEHIAEQMQSHPGRFRQTPVFFTSDETIPEICVFSETSVDSHEAATSALVMCPICGKKNRPEDTFKCRECGRDNLCLRHQEEKTFLCADCTAKRVREGAERQAADIGMNTRRAIEESNNGNFRKAYDFAQKADLNNAAIQGIIGYALVNGIGCEKDVQRGIDWWLKAAMQGSAPFQYNLGVLYFEGKDVEQDDLEAVKWFKKAAENGYAPAQASLASCYACARGVPKNESEAIVWCRKAAEKGFVPAQYNMGAFYYNGCNAITKVEAQKWLRMAAGKGYSEAAKLIEEDGNETQSLYEQAENYYRGQNGVKEDRAKAFELYQKAAEQGHADAQYSLGYMYAYGECAAKDEEKALFWYRKAAAQGHEKAGRMARGIESQRNSSLGTGRYSRPQPQSVSAKEAYEKGENFYYGQNGFAQSYADAVSWYRFAAGQGHVWAQYSLGYCYQHGQGVGKDEAEAVKWFRKAAEEGNAAAQCSLGSCYYNGQGVARNFAEAVKWYRCAVAQENAHAQRNLGLCYEKGQGVTQDYSEAANLYRKAIANGNERAKELLERVEQKIAASLKTKTISIPRNQVPTTSASSDCGEVKAAVVLEDCGHNKIAVIAAIRAITGMGLAEAKKLSESAPVTVVRDVAMSECKRIVQQLEKAGARVHYTVASNPSRTLGNVLRDARLAKGYSVEQIATKARILKELVQELENGDFHRIPAPIYGRGFVRLYADCVGLDPAPLVEKFIAEYNAQKS